MYGPWAAWLSLYTGSLLYPVYSEYAMVSKAIQEQFLFLLKNLISSLIEKIDNMMYVS